MPSYPAILGALAVIDIFLIIRIRRHQQSLPPAESRKSHPPDHDSSEPRPPSHDAIHRASRLRKVYFYVYALVLASDWLQGPYIYQIYHQTHQLPSPTIAALFATGFVSAGVTASFAGHLADKYGRKAACLVFCAVTLGSCLSVVARTNAAWRLPLLFCGRMLGGLSTTLLFTVFDTWMVAEHKGLDAVLPLDDMFSHSVLLSGVVALLSGIVGEVLIKATGSLASPFWLAILCLVLAFWGISSYWTENYGHKIVSATETIARAQPLVASTGSKTQLLVLGAITTVFEGSMYLFVFNWTPAMTAAHEAQSNAAFAEKALPLGLVFSCFMCAMILGSQVFAYRSLQQAQQKQRPGDIVSNGFMVDVLAIAASALLVSAIYDSEVLRLGGFQVFEIMVGVYFPLMGRLKSELVPDATRARIYAWLRLPLNVFVVTGLALTREGGEQIRKMLFTSLGGLLLVTALIAKRFL